MSAVTRVKTGAKMENVYRYSRLIQVGDWIWSSATAGRDYQTRYLPPDIAGQAHQAMKNLGSALAAIGAARADIVQIKVMISDMTELDAALTALATYFEGTDPVHSILCGPLPGEGVKIELEIMAFRRSGDRTGDRWVDATLTP